MPEEGLLVLGDEPGERLFAPLRFVQLLLELLVPGPLVDCEFPRGEVAFALGGLVVRRVVSSRAVLRQLVRRKKGASRGSLFVIGWGRKLNSTVVRNS